uniref:Uncharacterized protein n=1 Tax=Cacopsylla melanoneura TaxID=428564 RepID=A0A8D8VQ05_9HEMI
MLFGRNTGWETGSTLATIIFFPIVFSKHADGNKPVDLQCCQMDAKYHTATLRMNVIPRRSHTMGVNSMIKSVQRDGGLPAWAGTANVKHSSAVEMENSVVGLSYSR